MLLPPVMPCSITAMALGTVCNLLLTFPAQGGQRLSYLLLYFQRLVHSKRSISISLIRERMKTARNYKAKPCLLILDAERLDRFVHLSSAQMGDRQGNTEGKEYKSIKGTREWDWG